MRLFLCSILAVLFTMTLAVGSQAQDFSLYDAFTAPTLNPDLWSGREDNTNTAVVSNTETQRAVVKPNPLAANRFLQLVLRTGHAGTNSDSGIAGEGRQRLLVGRDDILSGEPSVVGVSTRVVVTSMLAPGCPTSADPALLANQARSRASLLGFFFNDGTSTGPTDVTGDFIAGLNIEQRSTDGKVIVGFINRCTNATCSTSATHAAVVFTRKWALNVPVPLTIVWDRANTQFIFTAGAEVQPLPYSLSDALPPVLLLYDLRVSNVVPNCTSALRSAAAARFDFFRIATEPNVFP
jgi:hypothetical protein